MTDSRLGTFEHIRDVQRLLVQMANALTHRALEHDRSKLEPPEVEVFDEFAGKLKDAVYGSEEYKEHLESMRPGLAHHYAVNDHHPEHFKNGIADMNLLQLVEMLCDWKAAGKRHEGGGDIHRSIEINAERFQFGDEIKQLLLNTAEVLV